MAGTGLSRLRAHLVEGGLLRAARLSARRHRRPLAAVLAGLAAAVAVHAAGAAGVDGPDGEGRVLLVAARDLPAGHRLVAGDLAERRWPDAALPAGAVARPVGRVLDGPMRRGEPVTDVRLGAVRGAGGTGGAGGAGGATGRAGGGGGPGGTGTGGGPADGLVAVAVRLADPASALVARAGEPVDVIAGPPAAAGALAGAVGRDATAASGSAASGSAAGSAVGAAVLVRDARVLAVPDGARAASEPSGRSGAEGRPAGGGLLGSLTGSDAGAASGDGGGPGAGAAAGTGGSGGVPPAGVVVVAVAPSDALRLAGAAGVRALSLARHSSVSM